MTDNSNNNVWTDGWSAGPSHPRWPAGAAAAWSASASSGAMNPPSVPKPPQKPVDCQKGNEPPEDDFDLPVSKTTTIPKTEQDLPFTAGSRLFVETEKLPILIKSFESFTDAAPPQQPRAVAFAPTGINITVGIPSEGRVHALDFPEFFFAHYRCAAPGFRAVIDLNALLSALTKVLVTHRGRCVRILDQPDNTLLVEGVSDDAKVVRYPLTPLDADGAPGSARILERAYYRYPMMLLVKAGWLSYLLKGIQQQRDVEVEFDAASRKLLFHYTADGATVVEGDEINPRHVLQNPFLPARLRPAVMTDNNDSSKTAVDDEDRRIVRVRNNDVACPAGSTASAASRLSETDGLNLLSSLTGFRYRERFLTRSIWLPVKRPKLADYVYLFLAPGEPLLIQYFLDVDAADARKMATYSSWLKPFRREENPQLGLSNGGSAAVLDHMVQLAPRIRGQTETLRAASVALQASANERLRQNRFDYKTAVVDDNNDTKTADSTTMTMNNDAIDAALKIALPVWPTARIDEVAFTDDDDDDYDDYQQNEPDDDDVGDIDDFDDYQQEPIDDGIRTVGSDETETEDDDVDRTKPAGGTTKPTTKKRIRKPTTTTTTTKKKVIGTASKKRVRNC